MKKLFQAAIITAAILTLAAASFAGPSPAKIDAVKSCPLCAAKGRAAADSSSAAKPAVLPDITLPFSFPCPHCSMKITIKTKADWTKDCPNCACGVNQLGCYNDYLKNKKK